MEQYIDVSELEAPEPLGCILEALSMLKVHQYLHVYHRMEPTRLYDLLDPRKLQWLSQSDPEEMVHIFIWNCNEPTTETEVRRALKNAAKTEA